MLRVQSLRDRLVYHLMTSLFLGLSLFLKDRSSGTVDEGLPAAYLRVFELVLRGTVEEMADHLLLPLLVVSRL